MALQHPIAEQSFHGNVRTSRPFPLGLKRGAITTGMDRGVYPTRLKQLGRHKTYAVLETYFDFDDPFEGHPRADLM